MSPSLSHRVERTQAAAARLVWLYGLSRFAAATVGILLTAGLLDYVLRLHDSMTRTALSLASVAVVVWVFLRWAWPALAHRERAVSTARRIERRFPQLAERLSSAIFFAGQSEDDPAAGSRELRQSVVTQTEALAADLDFDHALDRRAPRRAIFSAAAAIAAAAIVVLFNPAAAGLAIARLSQPWRPLPWPRRHELAFVEPPARLAKGDDLELAVVNERGPLPDHVQLIIRRSTSDGWHSETKEMKPLGPRAVCRLEKVTRGFEYRASGGDDDTMPWRQLTVVEAPQITHLDVLIDPPSYTGLPPQAVGRVATALVGSRLRLRGTLDLPIRSAALRPLAHGFWVPDVKVSSDGRHLAAPADDSPWLVERSGAFWLELTDHNGLAFGRDTRIELQATKDAPPVIGWETPADQTFATSRALVHVRGTVKDDLAVRGIQLRCLRPGQSDEEQIIDLFAGPSQSPTSDDGSGDTRRFEHVWDLSNLAGLVAGDVLALRITAEDYQPQFVTTAARRVTIIEEEELDSRLATRQAAIREQLTDGLRLARQCREQVRLLEARLHPAATITLGDLSALEAAQHTQRQVERLLGEQPEGAAAKVSALIAEYAANRGSNSATGRRLDKLLAQLRQLNNVPLLASGQELMQAEKSASDAAGQASPQPSKQAAAAARSTSGHLKLAGRAEDQVVQSLEQIVAALSERDNLSRIEREIAQIRTDQDALAAETDELNVKAAVSTDAEAAARAGAGQLAQRQLELARRMDQLQFQMDEMLARWAADEPQAAAALAAALDTARRLAIGGQMRDAAARLQRVQPGRARQSQLQASNALRELGDTLSPKTDSDPSRQPSSNIEQLVGVIVVRQRQTITQTEQLHAGRDREGRLAEEASQQLRQITSRQQQLADDVSRLGGQARGAAQGFALNTAASQMHRAAELLAAGDTSVTASDEQRGALDRLEQILAVLAPAQPATASAAQPAQEPQNDASASQDPHEIAHELKLLELLEQQLHERTAAIDALREGLGSLSEANRQRVLELSREQAHLAEVVASLIGMARTGPEPSKEQGGTSANRPQSNAPDGRAPPPSGLEQELLEGLPSAAKSVEPAQERPARSGGESGNERAGADLAGSLAEIQSQMRTVEGQLGRQETSLATQKQQRQIIRKLNRLWEEADRRAQNSSPAGQPSTTPQAGPGSGTGAAGPPRESAQGSERRTNAPPQAADMKDLLRHIWGHLPDKVRDQMQASLGEQFLPQYEKLIEEYYQRLSEQPTP